MGGLGGTGWKGLGDDLIPRGLRMGWDGRVGEIEC